MAATARSLRVCARQHTWTKMLPSSPGPMPLMAVKSSFHSASLAASISLAPTFYPFLPVIELSCTGEIIFPLNINHISSQKIICPPLKFTLTATEILPSALYYFLCPANPYDAAVSTKLLELLNACLLHPGILFACTVVRVIKKCLVYLLLHQLNFITVNGRNSERRDITKDWVAGCCSTGYCLF